MKENADKLRALDPGELAAMLNEGAESMFRLRFQMSMGQTDGIKKYRALRRERARVLTILRERGEEAPQVVAPAAPAKKGAPKKAAPKKAKGTPVKATAAKSAVKKAAGSKKKKDA